MNGAAGGGFPARFSCPPDRLHLDMDGVQAGVDFDLYLSLIEIIPDILPVRYLLFEPALL